MSRRLSATFTDQQYDLLRLTAAETGVSLAELVRRAVVAAYGLGRSASGEGFEESFGAWSDRDLDGATYVERLRAPGLGRRLGR